MAYMTQTIVECDRCGETYQDEDKVHGVSVTEYGAVNSSQRYGAGAWTSEVGSMDLCQNCMEEFAEHVLEFDQQLKRDE